MWFLRPRTIGAYLQGYVGAGPTGGFNAELGSGYSLPSVTKALPNPSLERTSTGMALGPRGYAGHHPPRGPSATPGGVRSAQTLGVTRNTPCPTQAIGVLHAGAASTEQQPARLEPWVQALAARPRVSIGDLEDCVLIEEVLPSGWQCAVLPEYILPHTLVAVASAPSGEYAMLFLTKASAVVPSPRATNQARSSRLVPRAPQRSNH